jgi:periplasmic divalent cation tolerance protein
VKATGRFCIVLVTAPDLKTARRLARAALEERAAACANLIPALESHYWWRGKMESGREVLVLFKTRTALARKLEKFILSLHPYDTPEFVVVPLTGGTKRYLEWLERETKPLSDGRSSRRRSPASPPGRARGQAQKFY